MHLNNKGTSIIFAVFAVIVLSILGITIFSLISTDLGSAVSQILSSGAFFTAESGWQIASQAIKDDKLSTDGTNTSIPGDNGYSRVSYLEGFSYDSWPKTGKPQERVANPEGVILHGTDWNNTIENYAIIKPVNNSYIILWNFQQRLNLIGGKLLNTRIVFKARRSGTGVDPQVRLQYSTDGGVTWYPDPANGDSTTGYEFAVDNVVWQGSIENYRFSPDFSGVSWQNFMINNGADFRIRVLRLNSGNADLWVDWLALEVTTEVDAATEPWGSNSYISLPSSVGNSFIQSITIHDESGKININYAPEDLMRVLFVYCGIPDVTARTISRNIDNYRASNFFNTIEEVRQVSGMTEEYFDMIDQDITVYSWINQDVTRPTGSRPPVNINTASENVLKAIINLADPGSEARIDQITGDIISQRETTPFASMYSSYETQDIAGGRDIECFAGFIQSLGYSWLSQQSYRRARYILNIADSSYSNMTPTSNWAANDGAGGVEFCYYSHTFLIESKGKSGNIERTIYQTYGYNYNYTTYTVDSNGALALPTYIGDVSPKVYWREDNE